MQQDERRYNNRLRELIDGIQTRLAVVEAKVKVSEKYHRLLIITVCAIAAGKSILEVLK